MAAKAEEGIVMENPEEKRKEELVLQKPEAKKQKMDFVSAEAQQQEMECVYSPEAKMFSCSTEATKQDTELKLPCYDDYEDEEEEIDPKVDAACLEKLKETDGFDVGDCYPNSYGIGPLDNFEKFTNPSMADLSRSALEGYNQDNKTKLEFVKVVKVNVILVKGLIYYITFEARDATDGQIKILETNLWHFGLNNPPLEVFFCRQKPGTA